MLEAEALGYCPIELLRERITVPFEYRYSPVDLGLADQWYRELRHLWIRHSLLKLP
jgi:hypothetical protein